MSRPEFLHTVEAVPGAERVSPREYTYAVVTTFNPAAYQREREEKDVAYSVKSVRDTHAYYSKVVTCTFKPHNDGSTFSDWGALVAPDGTVLERSTYPGVFEAARKYLEEESLGERVWFAEASVRERFQVALERGVIVAVASWHQSAALANKGADKALKAAGVIRAEVHATVRVPKNKRDRA